MLVRTTQCLLVPPSHLSLNQQVLGSIPSRPIAFGALAPQARSHLQKADRRAARGLPAVELHVTAKHAYTDPFGKHGQTQPFPGSIRQFIARINNDRGGLELAGPGIGGDRDYGGPRVHAPN